jgi:hypothetical protein
MESTFNGSSSIHFHHGLRSEAASTVVERNTVQGVGDITALGRYSVLSGRPDQEEFYGIFVQGGLKFATGAIDARDAYGYLLHPHVQSGTGTSNILVGLNGFTGTFTHSVTLNVLAGFPRKSANLYQEGWALNWDVGLRQRLYPDDAEDGPMVIGLGSVIGRHWARESYRGVRLEDSGGWVVLGSAGVMVYPIPSLSIEVLGQLPLATYLNGVQLRESYRIVGGVAFTL